MAEDAVFNIVIGVQNRERIKQLEKDIADAEKEINNLSAAINAAGTATTQQSNQLRMYGKDILAYRNEIEGLSKANIELGEASGEGLVGVRGMIRGLRGLAEGSEGVVSSLPMLASMMGASSNLATGIGVMSEIVVELHKHWEELKNSFLDRHGIDAAKTSIEDLATIFKETPGLGALFGSLSNRSEMRDILETRNAKKQDTREQIGEQLAKGLTPEQEQRGAVFQRAVKEYGGERLLNETVNAQTTGKNLSPHQIEEVRKKVTNAMGQAAQGTMPEGVSSGIFGGPESEFGKERQRQQQLEDFREEQKAVAEEATERKVGEARIAANLKAEEEKKKKWEAEEEKIMRSDEEFNKKRQEGLLQDQLTKLERQKRDQAEMYREDKIVSHGLQGDTRQMMASMMSDTMNVIPKQQLEVQKAMQAGIDKVKDELQAIRRVGLGAAAQ